MAKVGSLTYTRMKRIGITMLLVLAAQFSAGNLLPAHASTETVNTSADDNVNNGNCTLREAIRASVGRIQVDQCVPGSGNDLITFAGGLTPTINSTLPSVPSGTTIAIYGGSQKTTVNVGFTGGNVFVNSGTLSVQNVNMHGNSGGNCFDNLQGSLSLINESVLGCAIMVTANSGSVTLQSITGSGVDTHSGVVSLNISNSSFSGGTPFIFNLGSGGATITTSTFTDTQNSNLSIASTGSLNISRTMFKGNGITALSVSGGTTTLTNSIITQQQQGGIDVEGAQIIVTNSTIYGNVNGLVGTAGSVHLRNTILSNSSRDCYLINSATVINDGGNLQTLGDCPATIATGNPLLNGSFTPQAGSPAIDTALPSWCPATDFYGTARPKDGDGNGTAICDIGAVEK